MIKVSEVIEACARAAESEAVDAYATRQAVDDAYNMALQHAAEAIRALAAKYEGCIVAEGTPGAYTILDKLTLPKETEISLSEDGYVPQLIPRYEVTPLYRAKEPK